MTPPKMGRIPSEKLGLAADEETAERNEQIQMSRADGTIKVNRCFMLLVLLLNVLILVGLLFVAASLATVSSAVASLAGEAAHTSQSEAVDAKINKMNEYEAEITKTVKETHQVLSEQKATSEQVDCKFATASGVVGNDGENQCAWATVRSLDGTLVPMCLRSYTDMLSDVVRHTGAWPDCLALEVWWVYLIDRSASWNTKAWVPCGAKQTPSNKLFVDIGSNIGACFLPQAGRSDVEMALAFEMNPTNQFYLSSSIQKTPSISAKAYLYPYGLGETPSTLDIFEETGNSGNSVIGKYIGYENSTTGVTTEVIRLDQVFQKPYPYVHLMKLDAQGFEVKIFKGGKDFFGSGAVNAIKFEFATEWLSGQGTSPEEFLNFFFEFGFEIFDPESKELVPDAILQAKVCGSELRSPVDYMAVHIDPGAIVRQSRVSCKGR